MAGTIEEDILLLAHRTDKIYHSLSDAVKQNRAQLTQEPCVQSSSSDDADEFPMERVDPAPSKNAPDRQVARLHFLLNALSLSRNKPFKRPPSTKTLAHGQWAGAVAEEY